MLFDNFPLFFVQLCRGAVTSKDEFLATGGNSRLMDSYNAKKEAAAQPGVLFTASPQQKYGFDAYRKTGDTVETVAGKLNVLSFDQNSKKLYLVPVNGAKLPDVDGLTNALNRIYAQAITRWTVETKPSITVDFPGGQMTHGGSNAVSVFNADQKAVISAFGSMEKDALYLFFVENVKGKNGDIAGYMPLQRQAGFIYELPNSELIAHELGHGAFNLRHTFSSEAYIAAQGTTDNLMDYRGGTELWMHQWKSVQDPEHVWLSFLEGEEEGEAPKKPAVKGTVVLSIEDSIVAQNQVYAYKGTQTKIKVKFETADTAKTKIIYDLVMKTGKKRIYPSSGVDTLVFNQVKEIQLDSIPEGDYILTCKSGKSNFSLDFLIRKPKYSITESQLKKIFPNTDSTRIKDVVNAINNNSQLFGLTSKERMAHFLGQIGAETGGLKQLKENHNYTAKNIYDTFLMPNLRTDTLSKTGKTFKYCDLVDRYTGNNLTDCTEFICDSTISVKLNSKKECAWSFASFDSIFDVKSSYIKSESLFDYVYSCKLGNGDKPTKDGSTFFGKGFIQLTWKSNYKAVSTEWNKLYPNDNKEFDGKDINLLETDVEVAIKAAMVFWKLNGLNEKADAGTDNNAIDAIGKKINGSIGLPNGYQQRRNYTNISINNL